MDLKGNISILEGVKELSDLTDDLELSILYEHLKYIMSYMPEITDKSKLLLSSAYASRDRLTKSGNKLTSLSNTEIRLNHVLEKHSVIYARLTLIIYNKSKIDLIKINKRNHKDILDIEQGKLKLSFLDSLIVIFRDIEYLSSLINEIKPRLKKAVVANS